MYSTKHDKVFSYRLFCDSVSGFKYTPKLIIHAYLPRDQGLEFFPLLVKFVFFLLFRFISKFIGF